jgi:hypothetical protein
MNIDVIVLIVVGAFFIFTTYRYGKSYLTAFIVSFYPTYFLFDIIKNKLPSKESALVVGLFIVVFLAVLYVLRKNISAGSAYNESKRLLDSMILAAGALAQCAFVYYVFLPELNAIYNLSGSIDTFFSATISGTILALIPFAALLVSARG